MPDMKDAGPTAAALLIECRANGPEGLQVSPSSASACMQTCCLYKTHLPLCMQACPCALKMCTVDWVQTMTQGYFGNRRTASTR